MLQPKKVKFRRSQKGRMKGIAQRGNQLAFGTFGIKALDSAWITGRQIEAARIAVTRHMQRQGLVHIRIFPDKPISKKPAEVRMGKGKGAPEGFVAPVTPGRILIEIEGVSHEVATEALRLAAQKLPIVTKFIVRRDYTPTTYTMKINEIRLLDPKTLVSKINQEKELLAQLKFKHAFVPIENPKQIMQTKRLIARLKTVLSEK